MYTKPPLEAQRLGVNENSGKMHKFVYIKVFWSAGRPVQASVAPGHWCIFAGKKSQTPRCGTQEDITVSETRKQHETQHAHTVCTTQRYGKGAKRRATRTRRIGETLQSRTATTRHKALIVCTQTQRLNLHTRRQAGTRVPKHTKQAPCPRHTSHAAHNVCKSGKHS